MDMAGRNRFVVAGERSDETIQTGALTAFVWIASLPLAIDGSTVSPVGHAPRYPSIFSTTRKRALPLIIRS